MDGEEREILTEIQEDIHDIKITLSTQAVLLGEHIRRTTAAEERLDIINKELSPLKMHVALWGYLGKILAALATAGGLAATLVKLLGK